MIAGRTHPDIAHREGERYRLMLERRVLELGLGEHVEFDDRFLSIDELSDLLAATDVFVTPYRNREQIASGALTFAIAAGCGVVSTPYWYAQDMLASGAGTLVPFDDPAALADAVCDYHRAARVARGRAGGGAADRLVARLAVGRRGDRRRAARGARARARAGRPIAVADLHLADPAHRPPAHARRRRRDRAARARDHPEPRERLLRRRRRAPRGRLARARPPRRRAALDVDPLPRARVPPRRRPGDGGHAQLHELRPALARRAARRRPRRPLGLGARRDPRDRVDPGRRRADRHACSTGSSASLAGDVSLRTAAYAVLGLARLDPDRLDPRRAALLERLVEQLATPTSARRPTAGAGSRTSSRYDNARLPQALIVGGARARPATT